MSVVHAVGRGMAWNTAATVTGKFVMLANIFLTLHYLTVYEYGFTELVMSVISMMGIVLLPGLTSTVVSDMSVERGREEHMRMSLIFHQHFFLNVILGLTAWAVLFFGSQPVAELAGNPYAAQFLKLASFIFLIGPLRQATQVLSTVYMRFFEQSFYVVFEELFKLACILVFIVWQGMGIKGLVLSIVLSQFLAVLSFMPRTLSAYARLPHVPLAEYFHAWKLLEPHRLWSIGTSHVGTIATNARLWIIKAMLGTEAVGLFAFAMGMLSHVSSIVLLSTVLTPVLPRYIDKRDQLVRIVKASVKVQLIVSAFLTAAAVAGSSLFVQTVFPKYMPALPIIYILLLSVIANGVATIFTTVFAAHKLQRSLLGSVLFKSLVMLVVLPPSILMFGIVGMGVEVVVTSFANAGERYRRVKKFLPELSLGPTSLFKTDAYERQAMQMVTRQARSRLKAVLRF
ncbi:hypothetical protein FJY94_07240 [Candidatus Kaiserbacteria bacterium]|nr:hypothetical protein [Candidatus Kaiserbacteria bacterium]